MSTPLEESIGRHRQAALGLARALESYAKAREANDIPLLALPAPAETPASYPTTTGLVGAVGCLVGIELAYNRSPPGDRLVMAQVCGTYMHAAPWPGNLTFIV